MICPPERAEGATPSPPATSAPTRRSLTERIGSSQSGPSRAPHWKPATTEDLIEASRDLST